MEARGSVSNRFDDSAVSAEDAFQQVFPVARDSESQNFSIADGFTELAEQTSGVLYGIAFAQCVAGEQHLFFRREAYRFCRGRTKIAAHQDTIELFLLHRSLRRLRFAISIGGGLPFRIQGGKFL